MSLKKIPVLPESHPLYDWADWQSSRDALVSGTPTKYFAKEAWNAIIDGLSEALSDAGLSWDNKYTTAEGAKITEAYGKLTAKKFNSVRHNIDRPAPLGWKWAWKTDFRGYVGREDFKGRQEVGEACDLVYPEYIIELVRKLNLLLEIMRGTALIAEGEASQLSDAMVQLELRVQPAAHVETDHISEISADVGLRVQPSGLVETDHKSMLIMSIDGDLRQAANLQPGSLLIPAPTHAEGRVREELLVEPEPLRTTVLTRADVEHNWVIDTCAEVVSESQTEGTLDQSPQLPVEAESNSKLLSQVQTVCSEPLPVTAEAHLQSQFEAESQQQPAVYAEVKLTATTIVSAGVENLSMDSIEAGGDCKTTTLAEVINAWYPPAWVYGGLLIRQAHNVIQNENGELVIL